MFVSKSLRNNLLLAALSLSVAAVAANAEEVSPSARTVQAVSPADSEAAAKVNGVPITNLKLKHAVINLKNSQPDVKLSPDTEKKVYRNVLDTLIDWELLYQAGNKLEIEGLDNQVNERIAQGKSSFLNDADFRKSFGSADISDKEIYDNIRRDIVIANFVAKKISSKVTVSDEEIQKVYNQNLDRLTEDEKARISFILIGTNSAMTADEKKRAKEKAEQLHKQLLAGASFVALAEKYSTDAATRNVGGELGYVTRKAFKPAFADAIFALQLGQTSGVIETPTGYYIVRVRDKRPAVTKTLVEVKSQIINQVKEAKTKFAMQEFLENEHKKAHIEKFIK